MKIEYLCQSHTFVQLQNSEIKSVDPHIAL